MGYVETITVDLDRQRQFIVSFGTIRRFQKKTGKTFKDLGALMSEASQEDDSNEDALLDLIGNLLWAGCVTEDPEVTVDQIFDGLGMNPAEQLRPIFEAIQRAMPEAEDSPLEPAKPPKPPSRSGKSGGRSGRSGARS